MKLPAGTPTAPGMGKRYKVYTPDDELVASYYNMEVAVADLADRGVDHYVVTNNGRILRFEGFK